MSEIGVWRMHSEKRRQRSKRESRRNYITRVEKEDMNKEKRKKGERVYLLGRMVLVYYSRVNLNMGRRGVIEVVEESCSATVLRRTMREICGAATMG
jgi:hypothetical protein